MGKTVATGIEKDYHRYIATARFNAENHYIGRFSSLKEAIEAREKYIKENKKLKQCVDCGVALDSSYAKRCKSCAKTAQKVRSNEWAKADRKKNPEKHRASDRRYYKSNPEKMKEKAKADWKNNREKRQETYRKWCERNKDHIKSRIVAYEKANRGKINARARKNSAELKDSYIKMLLGLKNPPQELIEAKRVLIKLHRAIENERKRDQRERANCV